MKDQDIKPLIGTFLKTQSLIHSIDELSDTSLFKRELKQRTNRYLSFIEKSIDTMLKTTSNEEKKQYQKIVNELDNVVSQLEISF